ncbi:hypothetical protein NQ318_011494 [Aromia moschata]|uniref:C-type lectin domain-containing protein n=1 Tax=Aromia moschata TaxID=1265417 RepID=A0AAV8XG28_9CUCU|nr:hypothetical protein NQ318_011494 [Aromia moschata]
MSCLYLVLLTLSAIIFCETSPNRTITFEDWFNNLNEEEIPSLQLVHHGQKSYYFEIVLKANYYQALQFCRYHGMQLLSITSNEENEFLQSEIVKSGIVDPALWTSGTKMPDGTQWIWMSTGRPLIYTNWGIGEPNNAQNEQCISVRLTKQFFTWNDLNCGSQSYFICENTWSKSCQDMLEDIKRTSIDQGD